jgi:peptide/nickel transport system substrate-binding protein
LWYLLFRAYAKLSRIERAVFQAALLACITSGVFALAYWYYGATREAPKAGGSFVEGVVGQPTLINPAIAANNEADEALIRLTFADLGTLAESVTEGIDGKTISIKLRPNLRWSDGAPLTAEDALFTVEAIQNPNAHAIAAETLQGVTAEKLNNDEIRFTLKSPSAFFRKTAESLRPIPRHIFGSIPPANFRLSAYNLEPIGSGPYRFASMRAAKDGFIERIALEPNPHYPLQKPYIESFAFSFYRNEGEAIRDFNAKKISALGGLSPDNAEQLTLRHKLAALAVPRYYAVFMNSTTHQGLKDNAVRQALRAATDRERIVREVFKGYASVADGPIPAFISGYSPEARGLESSLDAARLLDAAGWIKNAEGVRVKTIGKERVALEFTMIVPDIPFLANIAAIIQENWNTVGVRIHAMPLPPDEIAKGPLKTRNYELILFGNILKKEPDAYAFWHSSQKFYPGLNLSLYENKAVDALLESVRRERDESTRNDALDKMQRLIAADAPAVFLVSPAYLYALPPGLRGFSARVIETPAERFMHATHWHLATRRAWGAATTTAEAP